MMKKTKNNAFPVRVAASVATMAAGKAYKKSGPMTRWAKREGPMTKYAKTRKM